MAVSSVTTGLSTARILHTYICSLAESAYVMLAEVLDKNAEKHDNEKRQLLDRKLNMWTRTVTQYVNLSHCQLDTSDALAFHFFGDKLTI